MLFNSLVFPLFFAVVYLGLRLLSGTARKPLLLAASYLFYAYWDWRFLSLILVSTAVDFLCGRMLDDPDRPRRKLWVAASVVVNLSILGTFKYLGFFVGEFAELLGRFGLESPLPVLKFVLPVGLSFYTFQSMGYTIDVYRGKVRATRNPLDFALFVAFFPQLVAGPIERAGRLLPQLQRPRRITRSDMAEGAQLVLWGYFKKLFVADNLAILVQKVFEGEAGATSGFMVLLAAYAFTWQLYCDFSGYTDIARGLARMMGVELTINFRLPFFATGPRELWRRWHVSLSGWLRDYLYIPLGGNRKGRLRSHVAMLITMVLGGLWHGANWTFALWGLYHGIALLVQRLLPLPTPGRAGRVLAMVGMFHVTVVGFAIFRAHDLAHLATLVTTLATAFAPQAGDGGALIQLIALIAIPFTIELLQYLGKEDLHLLIRLPAPAQAILSTAMLLAIVVLGSTHGHKFIYFQF